MKVYIEDDQKQGRFFIKVDHMEQAEMTFTWSKDKDLIINHTKVNTVLKGQGAARIMFLEAVNYARKLDVKILPRCSFVKMMFDNMPELNDLLG